MNRERREFLEQLWDEGRDYDAGQSDRLDRRRNLEPDSAQLLHVLVSAIAPSEVLELGTSNGLSSLWIADALEPTGGRLTTIDNDPERARQAADNIAHVGLAHLVDQRVYDAGQVLNYEPTGRWRVVFLDAERPQYVSYWPDLDRILQPGGLLIVDNCLSHADQVHDFRRLIDSAPEYSSTLVPTGAGLLLVCKRA